MRIKHYYSFPKEITNKFVSNSLNKSNWDLLRTDSVESPFAIEKDTEAFIKNCELRSDYKEHAQLIINTLNKLNWTKNKIVSLGAGKGILEYHLKKQMPSLYVECTDYTPSAIESLKKVFLEMDSCHTFDMLNDSYSIYEPDSILLLYRVSTEFDAEQWHNIFHSMYQANIEHIIFVPAELLTLKTFVIEMLVQAYHFILRRKSVFAGWMYSEKEFLSFFESNIDGECAYKVSKRIPQKNNAIFFLEKTK